MCIFLISTSENFAIEGNSLTGPTDQVVRNLLLHVLLNFLSLITAISTVDMYGVRECKS